jgi:hypothetical protein
MKKTIMMVAAAAMLSTAAVAGDFDNTAVKMTAVTDTYSLSVKAPKTGATEFAVGSTVGPVNVTGTWKQDGSTNDYAVKVGKTTAVGTTPLYAGVTGTFNFGDSYTTDTRSVVVEGTAGAKRAFGNLTPFAEVGYSFKSTTNDIVDFSRNASFVKVGASYAVTPAMSVGVSVKEARDIDFKNPGDAQAEVGLTVRF